MGLSLTFSVPQVSEVMMLLFTSQNYFEKWINQEWEMTYSGNLRSCIISEGFFFLMLSTNVYAFKFFYAGGEGVKSIWIFW